MALSLRLNHSCALGRTPPSRGKHAQVGSASLPGRYGRMRFAEPAQLTSFVGVSAMHVAERKQGAAVGAESAGP